MHNPAPCRHQSYRTSHAGQTGLLIQEIVGAGYTISDIRLFHLDQASAQEFLEVYKGVVPEYHVYIY